MKGEQMNIEIKTTKELRELKVPYYIAEFQKDLDEMKWVPIKDYDALKDAKEFDNKEFTKKVNK